MDVAGDAARHLVGGAAVSYHQYIAGREIEQTCCERGWPFYGLIQAAMRQADSDNLLKLRLAWPEVWDDLHARYNAPGGFLTDDERAAFVAHAKAEDGVLP